MRFPLAVIVALSIAACSDTQSTPPPDGSSRDSQAADIKLAPDHAVADKGSDAALADQGGDTAAVDQGRDTAAIDQALPDAPPVDRGSDTGAGDAPVADATAPDAAVPIGSSCANIKARIRSATSGIYRVRIRSGQPILRVYCEFSGKEAWTVIARSTTPSRWKATNEYALGHRERWIDADNYTYHFKQLVDHLAKTKKIRLRFYDHLKPADMDVRYELAAGELYKVNLDDTVSTSTKLVYSTVSTVFNKKVKAYAVGQTIANYLHIGQKDAYVKSYCDAKPGKSFVGFLVGNQSSVHATVCAAGLGFYVHLSNPSLFPVYNDNDKGRRVSIAYRRLP